MGHVGTTRAISQETIAETLKGLVWVMQIEGKWYETEFTGALSDNSQLLVKIGKPSKTPAGHRA